ncbi:MAG: Na+/H+ antiporter NhaC family protein [Myxococcales bacterium]|nr:Na+/H+ antiporter NhaC family protein [Myxococcales bacterium]
MDPTPDFGWLSLLPPLVAIALAIAARQVVVALLVGIGLGAFLVNDFNPLTAVLRTVDHYGVNAVADEGHASILLFSLLLGGAISVVGASGGAAGIATLFSRGAGTARRGLLSTWVMGIAIFFDDYANSLLVGSTMRPITDRLRVSREKLAFLVDATAAPVSSIALVSSWVGVEIGYIGDQFRELGLEGDPYMVFLKTLPFRFYPLLMLWFGLLIVLMGRDFGPMQRAEMRARTTGKVLRDGATPASDFDSEMETNATPRWENAAVPIATIILVAMGGIYFTGRSSLEAGVEPSLRNILSACDATKALLWSSFFGCISGIAMAVFRRSLTFGKALDAWMGGMKSMLTAVTILVLAWALGQVCRDVGTAQYVISVIGPNLHPALLSTVVFLVSAAVSFATGTSWGTMAILFPLVIPLAHHLAPGSETILLGAVSSILAGSVWGDHCSPISDTTILSSMACSCDHIDHVRTQLPYAFVVGLVAIVVAELPVAFGLYPGWAGLLLAAVALWVFVRYVGKPIPEPG